MERLTDDIEVDDREIGADVKITRLMTTGGH
jgi:hypothetical protein